MDDVGKRWERKGIVGKGWLTARKGKLGVARNRWERKGSKRVRDGGRKGRVREGKRWMTAGKRKAKKGLGKRSGNGGRKGRH